MEGREREGGRKKEGWREEGRKGGRSKERELQNVRDLASTSQLADINILATPKCPLMQARCRGEFESSSSS